MGGGLSNVSALIVQNASTIATVAFDGLSLKQCTAQQLVNMISGSIGSLVLASVDSVNIKAAVSGGFSSIGVVSGAGVLATGWEFPDNVMANGVPYISQTTGMPSIKVNGVVEAYS
jgi:hypothetical protein